MHNQAQIDADKEALAGHKCPETAADLKPMNKHAVRAHIRTHFPHAGTNAVAGSDYQRRADALAAYFTDRFREVL